MFFSDLFRWKNKAVLFYGAYGLGHSNEVISLEDLQSNYKPKQVVSDKD